CLSGPGFFKQEKGLGAQIQLVQTEVSGDGAVVTGQLSANSTQTQVIQAAGALSGAEIAFPPGAVAVNTAITIEEGTALATGGTAEELGLGAESETLAP